MIAHIQVLCNDTRPHTCTCIPYIRNVCDVCDDLHVNVCDVCDDLHVCDDL